MFNFFFYLYYFYIFYIIFIFFMLFLYFFYISFLFLILFLYFYYFILFLYYLLFFFNNNYYCRGDRLEAAWPEPSQVNKSGVYKVPYSPPPWGMLIKSDGGRISFLLLNNIYLKKKQFVLYNSYDMVT